MRSRPLSLSKNTISGAPVLNRISLLHSTLIVNSCEVGHSSSSCPSFKTREIV
eukprot:TRINITY_DN6039_c2_g1_i1.p3 TRINITY_DN6039_c2_g1~~TRINITY_DN6039_c2_g1_i1.p3  ORF type:complete len:53 (+),score=1.03 TRINITY_DN6039_c2_g1_i1:140-298(+)